MMAPRSSISGSQRRYRCILWIVHKLKNMDTMRLPAEFVWRHFPEDVGPTITLRTAGGEPFVVEVSKDKKGNLEMGKGLREFAEFYKFGQGGSLYFKYIRNTKLLVEIFGKEYSEINYEMDGVNEGQVGQQIGPTIPYGGELERPITGTRAPRIHSAPLRYRTEIETPLTKKTPTTRRQGGQRENKVTFTLIVPEPKGNNVYCKYIGSDAARFTNPPYTRTWKVILDDKVSEITMTINYKESCRADFTAGWKDFC